MHAAPVRLVTFAFGGVTVRLCSRPFGSGGTYCLYDGDPYEPLLLTWGAIRGDALNPRDYSRVPAEAEFSVDNTQAVGGYDSFSALFAAEPAAYTTVTVQVVYEGALSAGDAVTEFVGRLDTLSSMRPDAVSVFCTGVDLSAITKFPASYVNADEYPNAAAGDIGKMLPVVWGQAQRVPLRCLDAAAFVYGMAHAVSAVDAVYDEAGDEISSGFTAYTGQSGDALAGYSDMAVVQFAADPESAICADIDGWVDDGSGTYTGTADSLIERPDHILRHLWYGLCGLTSAQVDDDSYDASGAGYLAAGYVEAVVLTATPSLTDLVRDIAYQCKSFEFWEEGRHHLVFAGGDGAAEDEGESAATAVFGGGYETGNQDVIDSASIATTGNAADFGDLWQTRRSLCGTSNGTRGLFAGGYTTTEVNTIDFIAVATPGNAADFADLSRARRWSAAVSNWTGNRAVFAGGYRSVTPAGDQDVIDYTTIDTAAHAVDFGDLTVARRYSAGADDGTTGIFAGGSSPARDTIDYVTIATPGNATDFGDLPTWRLGMCGFSNGTGGRGIFAGGKDPVDDYSNVICYVTIGTPGNATDFGDLAVGSIFCAGASSRAGGRGLVAGGSAYASPTPPAARMEYVTIATPGNASSFGDLTKERTELAGLSGT